MTSRSAAGQSSAAARPAWSARAWRRGSGALAKARSRRLAPAMASSQLTHIDDSPAKCAAAQAMGDKLKRQRDACKRPRRVPGAIDDSNVATILELGLAIGLAG